MHIPSSLRKSACICVLVLTLFTLTWTFSSMFMVQAQAATLQAAAQGLISWDSSMIYPGQNGNLPWGPVGEAATVHGSGFAPNQQLTLVVVPGDSTTNPLVCAQAGTRVDSVATSGKGTFVAGFLWPSGTIGTKYSICARNGSVLASTRDNGPFTLLAGLPTIHISASSAAAGSYVTVTGQNWTPPQPVTVVIGHCGTCIGAPAGTFLTNTVSSSGLHSGSFSAVLFIPSSFPAGTYSVDAYAKMNPSTHIALLDANFTMRGALPQLAISAAVVTPTPTPSPTVSPTTTATVTATQTTVTNIGGTNTPHSGSQNTNQFPFIIILGALLPLLLTVIGLLIYMLRQRNKAPVLPGRVSTLQSGSFRQYTLSGRAVPGFQSSARQDGYQSGSAPNLFAQQTLVQSMAAPVAQEAWSTSGDMPQQPVSQDYAQPWPADAPTLAGQSLVQQTTHNEVQAYGSACFKCGSPLSAGSLLCNNCGTNNEEFFG